MSSSFSNFFNIYAYRRYSSAIQSAQPKPGASKRLCSHNNIRHLWSLVLTCDTSAPVNSAALCVHSSSEHYSIARVMLRFYSWMKVASLHHDYMCLVTVHGRNFTVWWCKWIPCGSSRGVETLSLGKVSQGESHPGWTLPMRGFSNSLLQFSSGEKFWSKRLAQLWQLDASFNCVASTLSLHGGKTQSC